MSTKNPRSDVWNHFKKVSKTEAVCEICEQVLKSCGNTTNLRSHLVKVHKIQNKNVEGSEMEKKKSSVKVKKSPGKPAKLKVRMFKSPKRCKNNGVKSLMEDSKNRVNSHNSFTTVSIFQNEGIEDFVSKAPSLEPAKIQVPATQPSTNSSLYPIEKLPEYIICESCVGSLKLLTSGGDKTLLSALVGNKYIWCFMHLSRRMNELSKEENHWKALCLKYWLETLCPKGRTWEDHFIHWYKDMGKYINCYAHMKKNWDKITSYFKINCPLIYDTIKAGVTEEELDSVEENMGLGKLPTDFRCSYRIHNGQRLTSPGIMGSMGTPGHYRSESLLDLCTILVGFREREGLKGCIPLTLCLHSGLTQYLAVTNEDGYDPNTIFYASSGEPEVRGGIGVDAFISGTSFTDWLTTHANHLANNEYVLMQEQPFRYLHESSAEETTNFITVSVSTAFLPEASSITPQKFYHTYRITMSMSADAPQSEACQLETRHWIITDDNGSEEQVDGPGVVGEYPVMYPGANFSWVSSTSFNTTYGNMKGSFRMRNLLTNERSMVVCPTFHMKCFPYITAEERDATKERNKKRMLMLTAA